MLKDQATEFKAAVFEQHRTQEPLGSQLLIGRLARATQRRMLEVYSQVMRFRREAVAAIEGCEHASMWLDGKCGDFLNKLSQKAIMMRNETFTEELLPHPRNHADICNLHCGKGSGYIVVVDTRDPTLEVRIASVTPGSAVLMKPAHNKIAFPRSRTEHRPTKSPRLTRGSTAAYCVPRLPLSPCRT